MHLQAETLLVPNVAGIELMVCESVRWRLLPVFDGKVT
jgi:hypothetical protein